MTNILWERFPSFWNERWFDGWLDFLSCSRVLVIVGVVSGLLLALSIGNILNN
jgi:hypothetical protein